MIKKIWNTVSTTIVILMVLMAVLLAGARLFGLQVFTVLTGSMEPNYHVGSIIYVKEVDPAELKVDDAISFLLSENTVATHRIIEVIPDADDPTVIRFRTKGDANTIADTSPVHCKNVLGKVVGSIPLLGYVSNFVQTPPGSYVTLGAAAIMILAVFLPDLLIPEKKVQEQPDESAVTQDENEALKAQIESLKQKIQQSDAAFENPEQDKE